MGPLGAVQDLLRPSVSHRVAARVPGVKKQDDLIVTGRHEVGVGLSRGGDRPRPFIAVAGGEDRRARPLPVAEPSFV